MTFLPRRLLAMALLALVAVIAATVVPAGVVSAMGTAPADAVGGDGNVCGGSASARNSPGGDAGRGGPGVFGLVGSGADPVLATTSTGVACCYTYANGSPLNYSDPSGYFVHDKIRDVVNAFREVAGVIRDELTAEQWKGAAAGAAIYGDYADPDFDFEWEDYRVSDWDDAGYNEVQRAMLWCRGDYQGNVNKFQTCVENQTSVQAQKMAAGDRGGVLDTVCESRFVSTVGWGKGCAQANSFATGAYDTGLGIVDLVVSPEQWDDGIEAVVDGYNTGGLTGAVQAGYETYVAPIVALGDCLVNGTGTERAYCAGQIGVVVGVGLATPSTLSIVGRLSKFDLPTRSGTVPGSPRWGGRLQGDAGSSTLPFGRRSTGDDLPKPPNGRGSAHPSSRDPQRLYTRDEVRTGLEVQEGVCLMCGDPLDLSDARGHHVDRHADGGQTNGENLAVLCQECHIGLHRK